MAFTTGNYAKFETAKGLGLIVWGTDTFKAVIMLSSHTPDHATHDFRDDTVAGQAAGQTAQDVPSQTLTADASYVYFNCGASATFSGVTAGQNVAGILIYKSTGAAATDILCTTLAFTGGAFDTNGQDITVNFNANGIQRVTFGA